MPNAPAPRIRGVHQGIQEAARTLRREMTPAERLLWMGLRQQGSSSRFRRQHPLGPFILDFCCPALRLVIELDGAVHDDPAQMRRDVARAASARGARLPRVPLPERRGQRRYAGRAGAHRGAGRRTAARRD